jgi:hypothetical protein
MGLDRESTERKILEELRLPGHTLVRTPPQYERLGEVIKDFADQGHAVESPNAQVIGDYNNVLKDYSKAEFRFPAAIVALNAHTEAYGQKPVVQERIFSGAHEQLQSMRADFSKGRGEGSFTGLLNAQAEGRVAPQCGAVQSTANRSRRN